MQEHRFESKSSPGTFHTTTVHDDGTASCTCNGWKYSKKIPKSCTHTDAVLSGEAISKTLTNVNRCPVYAMLASSWPAGKVLDDFTMENWLAEVKYNGHRRIVDTKKRIAWSRVGNEVDLPPQVAKTLASLDVSALIDCELILPGGSATDVKDLSNFEKLVLVAFDVLEQPSSTGTRQSCLSYTQVYRRALLQRLLPTDFPFLRKSELFPVGEAALQEVWGRGEEGLILKKKDGLYEPGKRSKNWVKVKHFESHAMMITGFEEGRLGPYSIILLEDESGATTKVKTLNDDWRARIAEDPNRFQGQVLFIEHQGRTPDGSFVSPMADHFLREDLP